MGANQSLLALNNSAQALAFKPIHATEHTFWNELWNTPTTPEQLWTCLHDQLLVQIRDAQPANLACLLVKALSKIVEIVFASKGTRAALKPRNTFVNSYTNSVVNSVALAQGADDPVVVSAVSILLNCIRIVTRILSVLSTSPHSAWWSSWLWGGALPVNSGAQVVGIDPSLLTGTLNDLPLGQVILLSLLDLCFLEGFTVHQSLATTIHNKESLRHNGVQLDKLWELGSSVNTGSPVAGPPNLPGLAVKEWIQPSVGWSNFDTHRNEVLRALLVCFGEPIFMPPNTGLPPSPSSASTSSSSAAAAVPFISNRFLREFVSETGACARWTPTLCWSLLNLVLNHRPEGTAILQMPYNYALLSDNREPLVEISLHFLLLVLDWRHGDAEPTSAASSNPLSARDKSVVVLNPADKRVGDEEEAKGDGSDASSSSAAASSVDSATKSLSAITVTPPSPVAVAVSVARSSNVFHAILTELSNGVALTSIFNNLCRLLINALSAEATWLPQSLKKLPCFQELLILMWKLVDENAHFGAHILSTTGKDKERCEILHLITPLLYFVSESRRDESQLGLCYTCVFLLLKLSGDREFSVSLNRAVSIPSLAHIPLWSLLSIPSITGGTYADALIVIAHKLVVSSPTHLDALLKVLLTLLSNISPYLTKLSLFASVKLLNLFELFTSPKFLYANQTNHQYATMMIDIFNNVIQYQYQGHSNLVYSLIRRAKLFYELGRMESLSPSSGGGAVAPAATASVISTQRDLQTAQKLPSAVSTTIALAENDQPSPARLAAQEGHPKAQLPAPAAGSAQQHSSSQEQLSSSTLPVGSFVATAAWKNSWKQRLPLEPIYRLLDFFTPQVDRLIQAGSPTQIDESAILSMISSQTLVGVLPVPHPIVVRKYIPNHFTNLWFSTFLTGIIFLRQQALAQLRYGVAAHAPLWNGAAVKMFVISNAGTHEAAEQERRHREAEALRQHNSNNNNNNAAAAANAQQQSQQQPQQQQQPAQGQSLAQSQQQQQQQQQQQPPQQAPQSASSSSSSAAAAPSQPPVQQSVV